MRNIIINSLKLSFSALVFTNFVNTTPSYAMEQYDLLEIFGQNFQDHNQVSDQNVIQNAPGHPNDLIQFQQPAPLQNAPLQGNGMFNQGYVQPQQGFAWTQQNIPFQGNMGFQGQTSHQQGFVQPQQGFAWIQQNIPFQGNMGFQGQTSHQQGFVHPQQGFAWMQQNIPFQGNLIAPGQVQPPFTSWDQYTLSFNDDPNPNKRKFDTLGEDDTTYSAPKKFHAVAARHIHITAREVFDELSCAYFTYYKRDINMILFVTKNHKWSISIGDDDTRVLDLLKPEYRQFFLEVLKSSTYYRKNQVTKRQAYIMALNGGILKNPTNDLLEYIQEWRETGIATFQDFKKYLGLYLQKPDQPTPTSLWNPVLALIEPANKQNGKYLHVNDYKYLQGMVRCFTEGSHLHFHKDLWHLNELLTSIFHFPKDISSYILHYIFEEYCSTKVMQNRR